jgi:hypothetical protein
MGSSTSNASDPKGPDRIGVFLRDSLDYNVSMRVLGSGFVNRSSGGTRGDYILSIPGKDAVRCIRTLNPDYHATGEERTRHIFLFTLSERGEPDQVPAFTNVSKPARSIVSPRRSGGLGFSR